MTTAQKIIKYLALCLAAFLIFSIISSIFGVMYSFGNIFGLRTKNEIIKDKMDTINFESSDINSLEIEVVFTNLIIKKGDFLQAETNNENINFNQNNKIVQIKEKEHTWFVGNNKGDLVVYIPENISFDTVKIKAGAGKIQIENIDTRKLSLELGAGETSIQKLNVLEKCKIESGAGKVSILNGYINELDLDLGVGKFSMTSAIKGNSKINAGIGSLELNVLGSKNDYVIKANKGIGNILIDGLNVSDNYTYGNGEDTLNIEGGIGSINVNFIE